MRIYTTIQGDTWDMIAHKKLGNSSCTDRLITANPEHIGTLIFPAGVVLRLPEIEEEKTADSLPPWKR